MVPLVGDHGDGLQVDPTSANLGTYSSTQGGSNFMVSKFLSQFLHFLLYSASQYSMFFC